MKAISKIFLFFLVFFSISPKTIQAQDFRGVTSLTQRVAPWTKDKIVFHLLTATNHERFEMITHDNHLHIYATSSSAAAMGFNYYLNHFCHQMVSHCGDNLKTLKTLPEVKTKLVIETPFQYRYALNYCTYSYSMSFYQWKDWEKELDWMALHGVNLMLAINGTEIIWQRTLQELGFSDKDIKNFIPGPAYTAWWLMGNLEGWGGPVTDDMINRQMLLQKKIIARMRELGIEPVLQGFYGMVPSSLHEKFPSAKIIEQGKWGQFQRPAILSPQDSLFSKMSDVYYQNIKHLYGDVRFLGGDPFHEGGISEGIDITLSAKNIQHQMHKHFPGSTWVLQGWLQNPNKELLRGLQKEKTLVLNLKGESLNAWEQTNAFGETPWIWCTINNFGDVPGMYGKLQHIVEEPRRALKTPQGIYMEGIGIAPEGIKNNPLLYDLSLNSAWGNSTDIDSLLHDYMIYRYGKNNPELFKGLLLLKKTVYGSNNGEDGCTESLFAARPEKEVKSTSSWGSRKLFYDSRVLNEALKTYLNGAGNSKNCETFKYDITDIARQVLANRGQMAYDSIMKYFNQKDIDRYNLYKKEFFYLINLQEQLMATCKSCLLGTRLQQAKDFGVTDYEKQLAEKNERMQITIWGPDTYSKTPVHDYAHKEWAGLIKDLYLPRWKLFFEQLDDELAGKPSKEPDFFTMELNWARNQNLYTTIPKENYLELINEIISF